MGTQKTEADNRKKDLIALACIAAGIIGVILGIMYTKPIAGTFSPGTLLALVAFLFSMGAVKDRGNNLPALLAFFIPFAAMSICVFYSGMAG
jgi:small basic protein